MTISDKDELLINILRENARTSVADIARRLSLSRTATQARLEKLERNGTIAGYTVRLGDHLKHEQIRALVLIKCTASNRGGIEAALAKITKLTLLHSISGIYDLCAFIAARNAEELDRTIDQIGQLDGVDDTMSSIILATKIDR